jgi:hypothetical protein
MSPSLRVFWVTATKLFTVSEVVFRYLFYAHLEPKIGAVLL